MASFEQTVQVLDTAQRTAGPTLGLVEQCTHAYTPISNITKAGGGSRKGEGRKIWGARAIVAFG
jgi:hypothetical protein